MFYIYVSWFHEIFCSSEGKFLIFPHYAPHPTRAWWENVEAAEFPTTHFDYHVFPLSGSKVFVVVVYILFHVTRIIFQSKHPALLLKFSLQMNDMYAYDMIGLLGKKILNKNKSFMINLADNLDVKHCSK